MSTGSCVLFELAIAICCEVTIINSLAKVEYFPISNFLSVRFDSWHHATKLLAVHTTTTIASYCVLDFKQPTQSLG